MSNKIRIHKPLLVIASNRTKRDLDIVRENPMDSDDVRKMVLSTEGKENKGGDPRVGQALKDRLSDKEAKEQEQAIAEMTKRIK